MRVNVIASGRAKIHLTKVSLFFVRLLLKKAISEIITKIVELMASGLDHARNFVSAAIMVLKIDKYRIEPISHGLKFEPQLFMLLEGIPRFSFSHANLRLLVCVRISRKLANFHQKGKE